MAVATSCPACRAPLKLDTAPTPGAAVRCPRCRAVVPAVDDRTQPPPSTQPGESDPAQTVARQAPPVLRATNIPLLAPPQRPDEIGRLGRYRVFGELGRGGMGVVYRAEEPQLRRHVALKVMLPQFASNPASKARFLREAHAQAAVEHAHVVIIYESGDVDGVAYLAMPLLKGQTLGAALKLNPRPPLREVVRIGRQVAEGLSAAHDVGLMHRDIKPGNVWLDGPRRQVKILDFGLARAADAEDESRTGAESRTDVQTDAPLTVQGSVVGTPLYMSPEQGRGEKVDFRTDLYSLGVMLYQMTTGKLPFTGTTPVSILIAIETETPAPPSSVPGVPPALSDLVMRLLSKRAEDRPSSAEAVAAELQRLELALESASRVVATPVPVANDPWSDLEADDSDSTEGAPVVRAKRPADAPRPRWPLFAAGGAAVLLVAVGVLALRPARTRPTEPESEPIAQRPAPSIPPKPDAPKEKEPPKEVPKDVPKPVRAAWAELADLAPTVRIDYSNGSPPKGAPVAKKDPDGKYEWKAEANALRFTTAGGTWWTSAGALPNGPAAVELKARVVSPVGAILFSPWANPAPGGDGWAGPILTLDHTGVLKLQAYKTGKTPAEFPPQTLRPTSAKLRGGWNTILTILRDDHMDVYVNGEEAMTGVALWPVPTKTVRFGVRWNGAPAEVEHERITIWDISTLTKK